VGATRRRMDRVEMVRRNGAREAFVDAGHIAEKAREKCRVAIIKLWSYLSSDA
jgi:hypothetical protein